MGINKELFNALEKWGFVPVTDEEPTGDVEYVVTIHKRQAVMYEFLTNTDALNSDPDAVKRLQKYLTVRGYYSGNVDGVIDAGYSRTVYALQRFLSDMDIYYGRFDGRLDDNDSKTIAAMQRWGGKEDTGHVTDDLMDWIRRL